jgi:hypothetical protein
MTLQLGSQHAQRPIVEIPPAGAEETASHRPRPSVPYFVPYLRTL